MLVGLAVARPLTVFCLLLAAPRSAPRRRAGARVAYSRTFKGRGGRWQRPDNESRRTKLRCTCRENSQIACGVGLRSGSPSRPIWLPLPWSECVVWSARRMGRLPSLRAPRQLLGRAGTQARICPHSNLPGPGLAPIATVLADAGSPWRTRTRTGGGVHALQRAGPAQRKRASEAEEKRKPQKAGVHSLDDGVAGVLQVKQLRTSLPALAAPADTAQAMLPSRALAMCCASLSPLSDCPT